MKNEMIITAKQTLSLLTSRRKQVNSKQSYYSFRYHSCKYFTVKGGFGHIADAEFFFTVI